MDCPHTRGCPLYPLFVLTANLELWKDRFCAGRFDTCERYRRTQAGEEIPSGLLPNGALLRKVATR